jgi:hypothetical protein
VPVSEPSNREFESESDSWPPVSLVESRLELKDAMELRVESQRGSAIAVWQLIDGSKGRRESQYCYPVRGGHKYRNEAIATK